MACVGCFYNLFTLIPILKLKRLDRADHRPAGLVRRPARLGPSCWPTASILSCSAWLRSACPASFSCCAPRAPREDLACDCRQRLAVGVIYFLLVLALAWAGSSAFEALARLVPEAMGD